jgi:eukaryotic-like serine/threonine-protein kinase
VGDGDVRTLGGGRYRLGEQIGAGGMARVYRAVDTRLERPVAVKVLATQFAEDPSFVDRFRREARTAAKLNHPNIVGVYDNGAEDGTNFIVMEFVEGRTLAEFIAGGGRLSPNKAVEVAEAVCRALSYAHEQGVVHRDIKPGNIMVTRDGQVKVMDFGIARLSTTAETVAQTAAVLGTAAYLSPEQAQGQRVDGRSDIYSLGCVLDELLSGSPPFAGDSAMAVAMQHVKETPPVPSARNPDITPQMDAVVMKALAKNPDNRYQTAEEFREDLERLRRGELVSATPIMAPAAPTAVIHRQPGEVGEPTAILPPSEEGGTKWWVWALVGAAIVAILLGGAYFLANSLLGNSKRVEVPSVVGLSEQDAVNRLEARGLRVATPVLTGHQAGAKPGEVIDQTPPAGDTADRGSEVTLTVENRQRALAVPSVTGSSGADATATLEADPYNYVVTTKSRFSDTVPDGDAIGTDPPEGDQLAPGSAITLLVSKGASPTPTTTSPTATTAIVPNVVCRSLSAAQNQITKAGLTPSVVGSQSNASCPNTNKVAAQAPGAGTAVAQGTTVKLWTSESGATSPPSS